MESLQQSQILAEQGKPSWPSSDGEGTSGNRELRVKGLGYSVSQRVLEKFFEGFNCTETHICEQQGWRPVTGTAFAKFACAEDARRALKELHLRYIGSRYVELYEARDGELDEAKEADRQAQLPGLWIRLVGLPYSSQAADVREWLGPKVKIRQGEQGVKLLYHPNGKPTGHALVDVATEADRDEAVRMHMQNWGNRYIEVFVVEPAEVNRALRKYLIHDPKKSVVQQLESARQKARVPCTGGDRSPRIQRRAFPTTPGGRPGPGGQFLPTDQHDMERDPVPSIEAMLAHLQNQSQGQALSSQQAVGKAYGFGGGLAARGPAGTVVEMRNTGVQQSTSIPQRSMDDPVAAADLTRIMAGMKLASGRGRPVHQGELTQGSAVPYGANMQDSMAALVGQAHGLRGLEGEMDYDAGMLAVAGAMPGMLGSNLSAQDPGAGSVRGASSSAVGQHLLGNAAALLKAGDPAAAAAALPEGGAGAGRRNWQGRVQAMLPARGLPMLRQEEEAAVYRRLLQAEGAMAAQPESMHVLDVAAAERMVGAFQAGIVPPVPEHGDLADHAPRRQAKAPPCMEASWCNNGAPGARGEAGGKGLADQLTRQWAGVSAQDFSSGF